MVTRIAGVDEVGRGCIAGAVMAAAVILDPARPIDGLADSKKLSAKRRAALAAAIKANALAWAIGRAEPSEIDRLNILQASLLAMRRAVMTLRPSPERLRVDGRHYPPIAIAGESIIGGDATVAEIAAASIIAKVARDREMAFLDMLYPGYEFARHKGYPTALHQQKLHQLGISPVHRRSYAPVRRALVAEGSARV